MKDTTVTVRMPATKLCPYREGETDHGRVRIRCPERAPELHLLGANIERIAATPSGISHEDFTDQVALLLPAGSRVTSWWHTGPFDVKVTATSPWPAAGCHDELRGAE